MRQLGSTLLFLTLAWAVALGQGSGRTLSNDEAVAMYDKILSTRNPNAVLDILSSFSIEQVPEDSLKSYFYYYKGSAFGQLSVFDSAVFYVDKAKEVLPARHPVIEIQIYRAYGNINWARNFYHLALSDYEDALKIADSLNNAEFQISLLGNIGGIYAKLDNLPLALDYTLRAEQISERSGVIRPRSHMKIGTYLMELGRHEEGLRSLEKTQALIEVDSKDSIALGVNYINKAQAHLELKNLKACHQSLEVAQVILNRVGFEYPSLYMTWASFGLSSGNLPLAKSSLDKAFEVALKQRDKDEIKKVTEIAKQLALKQNRLADVIKYQDEIYALNDSIKDDRMVNRVYELQTLYETEQKEAEIERLKLENLLKEATLAKTQGQLTGSIVIGVLLVILGIVFIVLRNKKVAAEKAQQEFQMDALKQRITEIQAGSLSYDSLELESINTKIKNVLSDRELETLKLVLAGKSNKEIGEQLFISVNTVKFHLKNIYEKIGVANRKEALQFALKANQ